MGTPNHDPVAHPRRSLRRLIAWSIVVALLAAFAAPPFLANMVTKVTWSGSPEPVSSWSREAPLDWPPPTYRIVQSRFGGVLSMYVTEGFLVDAPLDSKWRQRTIIRSMYMHEVGWPLRSFRRFSCMDMESIDRRSRSQTQSRATCGGSPPLPDLVFADGSTLKPGLVLSEYRAWPLLINLVTWFAIALLSGLGLRKILTRP